MDIIGLDVGFGFTKGVRGNQMEFFPSIIADHDDSLHLSSGCDLVYNNAPYVVGDVARLYPFARWTSHSSRSSSVEYKVLALSMLALLTPERRVNVSLVTGLPINHFRADCEIVTHQLLGAHEFRWRNREYRINVKSVDVIPQPLGTYFSVQSNLSCSSVGIVDIGFLTSDCFYMKDGIPIPALSESINLGCDAICGIIRKEVYRKFRVDLDVRDVDSVIRSGCVAIMGEQHDARDIIDSAVRGFLSKLHPYLLRLWGKERDYQVVYSGGGAALMEGMIDASNYSIAKNPQFSNVNGYALYGALKAQAKHVRPSRKRTVESKLNPGVGKEQELKSTDQPD